VVYIQTELDIGNRAVAQPLFMAITVDYTVKLLCTIELRLYTKGFEVCVFEARQVCMELQW
jgi:hypothetical protein